MACPCGVSAERARRSQRRRATGRRPALSAPSGARVSRRDARARCCKCRQIAKAVGVHGAPARYCGAEQEELAPSRLARRARPAGARCFRHRPPERHLWRAGLAMKDRLAAGTAARDGARLRSFLRAPHACPYEPRLREEACVKGGWRGRLLAASPAGGRAGRRAYEKVSPPVKEAGRAPECKLCTILRSLAPGAPDPTRLARPA